MIGYYVLIQQVTPKNISQLILFMLLLRQIPYFILYFDCVYLSYYIPGGKKEFEIDF